MIIYKSKFLELHGLCGVLKQGYFCTTTFCVTDLRSTFKYYENIQNAVDFIYGQDKNLSLEQAVQLTKIKKEFI